MNKYILSILACVALLMGSCTTVKKTATSVPVSHTVAQYPTVTDLEVMPKVEASCEWFSLCNNSSKLMRKRGNLVAETLKSKDADVLLEPHFIIVKSGPFSRKVTVIGYPAKYKNFRKASASDIEALKAAGNVPASPATVYNSSKGGLFGIFKK